MWSRKLSPSALYWFNTSWQTCVLCSLCSCVNICGTHLAQTLQYSNVATIISKALKPIFSSVHSSLVVIRRFAWMSWLRHFISWCGSCAWLSGTWLVFHVAVTTAEMRHVLPHCANIHCLVSLNVQNVSMNVIEFNFFRMEEFSYTPLLHTHFHVRCSFVRLPLCCHLSHGNKI